MSFLLLQSGTSERHRLIGLRSNPGRLWRAVKRSGPGVQVKRASECLGMCLGPEELCSLCWLSRAGEETEELVLFNDSEGVSGCVCWIRALLRCL